MDKSYLKHPIYIISKGRYDNPLTARFFMRDGVPFKCAVEPHEYDQYVECLGEQHVLKLPFANLGMGSYPARNYCWEHALEHGHSKHFLFDDNIYGWDRVRRGIRTMTECWMPLIALQNFVERYKNIAIAGYNYDGFITRETKKPFAINTHVYSAMLIDNSLPYRWRLKYNEDVDLCLQALHDGHCTVLFNAYVVNKVSTTHKMKGGNQTELYKNNDHQLKMLKTKSLERMWPQYVKTVFRFGRPHHSVQWQKHFKQPLIKRPNYEQIINEQSIELKRLAGILAKSPHYK